MVGHRARHTRKQLKMRTHRTIRRWLALATSWGYLVVAGDATETQPITLTRADTEITITIAGQPFTTYRFGPELRYPFFYPVNGPWSGKSVTACREEPFAHHSSLFFSCDKVNDHYFWRPPFDQLASGQMLTKTMRATQDAAGRVVLTTAGEWAKPGEPPIMRDRRRMTVTAPAATRRLIDCEIELTPLVDLQMEKSNHGLFAARLAADLAEKAGGGVLDAEGRGTVEAVFGKTANWMAGYGKRPAGVEGLAIFQHPANRWHPAPWFARSYGMFSPMPMNWLKKPLELSRGDTFTLRYRVVVFGGEPNPSEMNRWYAEYAAEAVRSLDAPLP